MPGQDQIALPQMFEPDDTKCNGGSGRHLYVDGNQQQWLYGFNDGGCNDQSVTSTCCHSNDTLRWRHINLHRCSGGHDHLAWTGPNSFTSNVQSPTIPSVTAAAAGTYTLTVTNSSGCTASTTVDVTINPLPVPVATATTPCVGGTLTFTGAPAGMTTYAWTGPNSFTSNVQSPTIPSVTAAAAGTYTLTVTNSSGCTASTTVDVTINPLPVPVATATTPCVGGTLTFTGAPAGMTTYAWTGPNSFTSNVQSPTIPSVTAAAAGTYTLTVTNSSGCTASTTVDVTINPLPVPVATATTPCVGGTLTFTGAPAGMTTYAWTGPNSFTSNVQSPTIPSVTAAAAGALYVDGNQQQWLYGFNDGGCNDQSVTSTCCHSNDTLRWRHINLHRCSGGHDHLCLDRTK